jgi:probable F420-dependent oxidoreductase
MKLAINLLNFGECATVDNFRRWADFAEERFDAFLISDHIAVTPDVAVRYPAPFVDPFVLLGWAAARTSRIQIGTTVTILPYRHPLHTARLVADVDQLSNGRFIFGVGVGWARQEFDALGLDFEHRGSVANEYLEAMKTCWTQDVAGFNGRFVSFSNVQTRPRPVQQPHPPIWVGGSSDAALLRAVRYATAWHPIRIRMGWLREVGYPKLKAVAQAEGKAVPELCPRIMLWISEKPVAEGDRVAGQGTLEQIRADLEELSAMGAKYVTLDTYSGNPADLSNLDAHFEALLKLRSIWPSGRS